VTPGLSLDTSPVALDDGRRVVRRDELEGLVAAEARWLGRFGDAGSRHALLADNGIGWAVSDLALHAMRAVNVPLPGYFTDAQLAHALADADIDLVLTDQPLRVLALIPGLAHLGDSPQSGLALLRRPRSVAGRRPLPAGTTKVTYTSGSTGAPKGVCLDADTLERVAHSLADVTRPLGVRRHLCLLPLATLLDNVAGLVAAPLAGATTLLPSTQETGIRFGAVDVPALLACIERHAPESMILVPELLRVLVGAGARGWRPPASLKFVAVGGAAVAPALLERATALGLPVYEGYGLSECASVVALNAPGGSRPGSAGRVLPHARVRVDADGQILVGGATMLGYLGDPPDVAQPAEVATGDLGELDADGYLHVRGRCKNLFITSFGRNVSPEWVERELLLDPAIGQAVALGEARPYAVALVVATQAAVTDAQLGAAVEAANARLPDYARVRRWTRLRQPFTFTDGALTANGRVRREVVRARHAALIDSLYDDEALAS
jgi:long-subunit acyl-CoA synthetase (AMP-forming)